MKKETLYSSNFTFFINHQIGVMCTHGGETTKFFSRLDGQLFFMINDNKVMTDENIKVKCYEIHKTLNYYKELVAQ